MTSISLLCALSATAALGTYFPTTRRIGIAAFAALCFLLPWLTALVVAGLGLFIFAHRRKR